MHSIYQRLQGAFGLFVYANVVLTVVVSVTAYFHLYSQSAFSQVSGRISSITSNTHVGRMLPYGTYNSAKADLCRVYFDLDYDVSDLFNWNTKQVFLYAVAEYPGARPDINNRIVFWDKIIKSKEDAVNSYNQIQGSYQFWDPTRSYSEKNATISLEYNVQPYTGFTYSGTVNLKDEPWFIIKSSTAAEQ